MREGVDKCFVPWVAVVERFNGIHFSMGLGLPVKELHCKITFYRVRIYTHIHEKHMCYDKVL